MKNKISMYKEFFLNFVLQKVKKSYIANSTKSVKYEFLTPNDDAENIEEYSLALEEALKDGKVKNIAISGSYGSGKSSFIKTFERKKSQYKFLDISLAKFNKKDKESESDLSLIEKSILEQMFYRVKNKTLPQSRLKKINRLKFMPFKTIFIMAVVLAYFLVFSSSSLTALKDLGFVEFVIDLISVNVIKYLSIILLTIGVYFVISKLLVLASNINIEKLNLRNLELETNNNDSSLLNKYLDEILYFFEKTSFDVVVFQDLDRFENLDIFTKLRELNNFINNSEQVGKKIVFIYAVKDDMFKNANERTKFFDFLIPIIPYINSTNSKDKLLSYFNQNVDKSFLYDISLYISDMRLLKNIYTEYLIYSDNLDCNLNQTKLLAMIIYKNFEPQDFELLHKGKGLVYNIFNKKNGYVTPYISEIEDNISNVKTQIKKIDSEPRDNIKELRQLYILEIINRFGDNFQGNFYIDNEQSDIENIVNNDNFKLLLDNNAIYSNYHESYRSINFKDIETKIGIYDNRKTLVLNKTNDAKNKLFQQREKLQNDRDNLENLEISEIVEKFGDDQVFSDEKIKDKKLLKYLISYGHIDRHYENYISNFFGVSITKDEQKFLLNIKNNGKHLEFNYKLTNLEDILLDRLSDNEFKKESVLNYDLVSYIGNDKNKYQAKYKILFQQLSNSSELSKKFILDYIKERKNDKTFLEGIIIEWSGFWEYLTIWGEFYPVLREEIFYQVLSVCDKDTIIQSNYDNYISEVMAMLANWYALNSDKETVLKFKKIIQELDIKFYLINYTTIDDKLLNYLYENDFYALTKNTINSLINAKCNTINQESLNNAHLSTIKTIELKKLFTYINTNINTYIKDVFLKIETNTEESENTIIELLSNQEIEESLKEQIIKKQETKISDIETINKKLWKVLISDNKLQISWLGVSLYYDYCGGLNNELITYLNIKENAQALSKIRVGGKYCEEHPSFNQELLRDIIETDSFTLSYYEFLIQNIGCWYEDLNISKLKKDKILLLIKHNIFRFNKACFDGLKEHDDTFCILLIEKNKEALLEEFEGFEFNIDDVFDIIWSSKIPNNTKEGVIEKFGCDLIIDSVVEKNGNFKDGELIKILELLPKQYKKIANLNGKQTVLDKNNHNDALVGILKEREFITKYKIEGNNKIRLYIKKR